MSCAIEARGLTFGYAAGAEVLRGLDLSVAHGERVAVLGPNGAGKTTLMLHLNGLLLGAGELEVAGLEVGPDTFPELRARVGLVFQDPDDQLFMPTVAETSRSDRSTSASRRAVAARAAEALAAVRMEHVAPRAPYQLSMGERRRVAIAGVLAMDPGLLVLDEPSANLDPRARRELLDLLAALGRTKLVATHDLPFAAELCERAVILAGGRIVGDGPTSGSWPTRRARRARPGAAGRLRPGPRAPALTLYAEGMADVAMPRLSDSMEEGTHRSGSSPTGTRSPAATSWSRSRPTRPT